MSVPNRHDDDLDLFDPPACPSWCTGLHVGEQAVPEIRECLSALIYLPDFKGYACVIQARRVFDRVTGMVVRPPVLSVEDTDFTPAVARTVAAELLHAADLIEGVW
jgi:hypothetical protein